MHMPIKTGRFVAGLIAFVLFSANLVAVQGAHAAGPYAPGSPNELSVVQQSVFIDYGTGISITMIIDTGSRPVDSVRALFRPRGGSTVWSYDYPDFVIEGERMSVTFEISTGPGSYYPPGTEFETEIEFTHAGGDRSIARSAGIIEYLDPAKNWQRAYGDGYSIVYYGVPAADVSRLINRVNARIPGIKNVLGAGDTPDFPIFKAVVFPSVKDATPSFPPVSQTATDQLLFAGFAQPQYRLFVQGQMNSSTFVHELTHLYTHEVVSSPLQTGIPSWLNEGLARFLETGSSSGSNTRLRSRARPDEFLSLRNMRSVPGQRSDVLIFYPQAGAFVGYLVEEYGAESMAAFLAVINGGQQLLPGFKGVYGRSLYDVENDWRARFDAGPLAIPSATPDPPRTASGSPQGTSVPLVDYSASAKVATVLAPLPTAAPQTSNVVSGTADSSPPPGKLLLDPDPGPDPGPDPNSGLDLDLDSGPGPDLNSDPDLDPDPDPTIFVLVAVLSIVAGVWLFTYRRSKLSKRRS